MQISLCLQCEIKQNVNIICLPEYCYLKTNRILRLWREEGVISVCSISGEKAKIRFLNNAIHILIQFKLTYSIQNLTRQEISLTF